jgi:hypothetical protein
MLHQPHGLHKIERVAACGLKAAVTCMLLRVQPLSAAAAASAAYEASAAGTAARERATAELLAASRRIVSRELAPNAAYLAPAMNPRAGSAASIPPRCALIVQ